MSEQEIRGQVHSLESFGLVDGPGVRFVVFLQGCRMRCQYCHNPETWALSGGEEYSPAALLKQVMRYRRYWGENGGITVSGGEPLLQLDFVTEFFNLAKKQGVHTALDTAGNPFTEEEPFFSGFQKLMQVTDLVILDFKEMDSKRHRELTGWDNDNILSMARHVSESGTDLWLRHVLVPGLTDQEKDLQELKQFAESLKTLKRQEVLPYHTMGLFKWKKLGIPYPLEGVPTPTEEEVARAEQILGIRPR